MELSGKRFSRFTDPEIRWGAEIVEKLNLDIEDLQDVSAQSELPRKESITYSAKMERKKV